MSVHSRGNGASASSQPSKGLSDEAGNRLSGRSEASSEDGEWELVSRLGIASSPSSLQEHKNARGQEDPCSAGQAAMAMAAVNSAGDWLQWGLEGAVRGVERTYDGLNGLMHYKRLTKERKEALELASRQQWMLMELEQERDKERERMQVEGERRLKEMHAELARVDVIKAETADAVNRLRETEDALKKAGSQTSAMASEVERLRKEAKERSMQEAAAVNSLKGLEERQKAMEEEERRKARELEEKEMRLKELQERQEAEISFLKRQLQRLEREARDKGEGDEGGGHADGGEGVEGGGGGERGEGGGDGNDDDDEDVSNRRISFGLELPDEFYCSITMEVMTDPVIAADGFSYERDAIQDWLGKGHKTSPKTGANLSSDMLLPNHSLKSLIQDRLQQAGRQLTR